MDHRLFAILAVVCFAWEGAGCASRSARERRDEIMMPLQTGSTLHRRVVIDTGVTQEPKKKISKRDSTRRRAPEPDLSPSPKPKPKPSPKPKPESEAGPVPTPSEEETPAPPDRFR